MVVKSKEVKKITVGSVFSWIFGILFLLAGFGVIATGSIILGILIIICSIFIIPSTNKFTKEKFNFELSSGIKWILVILIFILFAFTETNANKTSNNANVNLNLNDNRQSVTTPPTTQISKVYGLNDKLVAGDFTWKITDVSTSSQIGQQLGDTFMGEKANGVFVILDVEVENTGNSANYLSDSFIKLIDDQNREFTASTMAAFYLEPRGSALSFEQINPGLTKKGKIVFDVPKGLKVVNVRISSSFLTSEYYTVKIDIP